MRIFPILMPIIEIKHRDLPFSKIPDRRRWPRTLHQGVESLRSTNIDMHTDKLDTESHQSFTSQISYRPNYLSRNNSRADHLTNVPPGQEVLVPRASFAILRLSITENPNVHHIFKPTANTGSHKLSRRKIPTSNKGHTQFTDITTVRTSRSNDQNNGFLSSL